MPPNPFPQDLIAISCRSIYTLLCPSTAQHFQSDNGIGSCSCTPQDPIAISRRSIYTLLCPLLLWLAVVGVLWGLTFFWISTASERVLGLDASERWVSWGPTALRSMCCGWNVARSVCA